MADRPLGVEVNLGLALGGTLGGDYDYAVAALGSVDSGQGGILEDVNRLNIRGGDIVYVVGLESVDDVKRIVGLGHRRRSAHTDVDVGSGLTVDCGDLHACNLACRATAAEVTGTAASLTPDTEPTEPVRSRRARVPP